MPSIIGHYHTTHRFALIALQAANSRLFVLRNTHATNLVVVRRIKLEWFQTANHTAAILDSLDCYKLTGFTTTDTTATVTPVAVATRTSFAASAAVIRGVTVAGDAAGMTGGTSVKASAPFATASQWLLATMPTAGTLFPMVAEYAPRITNGDEPLALVQDEGFLLENRVLLGAAAGSSVSISVEWSESKSF